MKPEHDLEELCDALDACGARLRLGEQSPSSDELEIAKLRRELTEARADISVLRDDRDRIRTVSAEALALRDRLSTIVDEALGPQEVLGMDALLSRLEHLLAERARQHEEVRRELDRLGADRHDALARRRAAAQILIAEIGASGPEDVEETARRAVERIQELKGVAEDLCSSCGSSIYIGRLTEALQDLVKSVEATKTRDAIVLRDLEAARAVLGGRS